MNFTVSLTQPQEYSSHHPRTFNRVDLLRAAMSGGYSNRTIRCNPILLTMLTDADVIQIKPKQKQKQRGMGRIPPSFRGRAMRGRSVGSADGSSKTCENKGGSIFQSEGLWEGESRRWREPPSLPDVGWW